MGRDSKETKKMDRKGMKYRQRERVEKNRNGKSIIFYSTN